MKSKQKRQQIKLRFVSILLVILGLFLIVNIVVPSTPVLASTMETQINVGGTAEQIHNNSQDVVNEISKDAKPVLESEEQKAEDQRNEIEQSNRSNDNKSSQVLFDENNAISDVKNDEHKETDDSKEVDRADHLEDTKSSKVLLDENNTEYEREADYNTIEETELNFKSARAGLLPNELEVNSFKELKKAIESSGNGVYDTFYLGVNIIAENSGISIPRNFSFTIDGKNPMNGKTYTYFEHTSTGAGVNIWYSGNDLTTLQKVTVRNMKIEGQNNYGVVGSEKANFAVEYDNVDYSGPRIAYTNTGISTIKDSRINIVQGRSSTTQGIIKSAHAELEGHNIITIDSIRNAFDVSKSLTFKSGSNSEFNMSKDLVENDTLPIVVEEGAMLTTRENRSVTTNNVNIIRGGTLENHGTINIETQNIKYSAIVMYTNIYNTGTINITSNVISNYAINVRPTSAETFVNDGGNINISVNKIDSYIIYSNTLILLNDAKVNINVDTHGATTALKIDSLIDINNSSLTLNLGKSTKSSKDNIMTSKTITMQDARVWIETGNITYKQLMLTSVSWSFKSSGRVPSYLVSIDKSKVPLLETGTSKAVIETQQLNAWAKNPSFTEYPNQFLLANERMYFKDGSQFAMSFQQRSGTISGITSSNTNTDYTSLTNLMLNNREVIAMGYMIFDIPNQITSNNQLDMKTNPNAWVRLVTDRTDYTYADEHGEVHKQFSSPILNGEYVISSYGNYLFRESKITYRIDGKLEIEKIPTSLDFGKVQLATSPTTYPRQTTDQIIISDERIDKTGWKLVVTLEMPLHIENKNNSAIPDALIYQNPLTKKEDTITSTPIVVHETSGNYNEKTVIDWEKDDGIQLFIKNYNQVYANEPYQAKLVWKLYEK